MSGKAFGAKNERSKKPKWSGRPGGESSTHHTQEPLSKPTPDIRKYVEKGWRLDSKEHWLSCPELPTAQEIMGQIGAINQDEGFIDIATNRIDGPWESREAYLNAHYEMLREDSVALLRDAVAYVREEPTMTDTHEVCIYEKVYITGITFSPKGIATKVSFSTLRAGKNIVWEYSNRLVTGSIVALSPVDDCFKTKCLVAVVAARPLNQLKEKPRKVDLFFADVNEATFDTQQEWIMVQARSGYFESTRHTMKSLQAMVNEKFPFTEHLCALQKEIDCPDYIQKNPRMKLFADEEIDILAEWPSEPQNNLDKSQWEALHQILTKRLAIVQGPPGTGKTHVSVAALQLLLSWKKAEDPPIVVAAHTNHALDQLLNHIAVWAPDYIRLGGRSLDENVKKRTLIEIMKTLPDPRILTNNMLSGAKKRLQSLKTTMTEFLGPFSPEPSNDESSNEVLSAAFFHRHKILTDKQYQLLCDEASDWVGPRLEVSEPMRLWLGDAVDQYSVSYEDDNFKQEEEVDLEYEQLKELEQERDYLDDEFEALKGTYFPLRETFFGRGNPDEYHESELDVENLWRISPDRRGGVYNILRRRAKAKLLRQYREQVHQYSRIAIDRQIGKWEQDYMMLKDAKIIGMTTTGLSKYRALVSALKPKIIMIEEAAETIEAPVTAACVESLEHLILVGDHKQLQGSCSVSDLEGDPFFLNVSMFERLVHNGVDFRTLTLQRRMVPEIRRLLTPIYDNLEDHETVHDLAQVPAMGNVHSFFFCHQWPENSDSLSSKYNHNEALMVATFFVYLVLAGVDISDITVLTFYNGQRKIILKLLKENRHLQGRHIKVVTVDSYQGEENQIVLLSLVRSSENRGIGFLAVENRVCVALSRARRGFYMFGNAEHLAYSSPLWWEVIQIMGRPKDVKSRRIGYYLPLTCANHGNQTHVQTPEHVIQLSGGCRSECKATLDCGHPCPLLCHVFDHSRIQCQSVCGSRLACGHMCSNTCSAETCLCATCGHWAMNDKPRVNPSSSLSKKNQERNLDPGVSSSATYADKVRHEYQQFAVSGMKEHDRNLEEARRIETAQELLARLDAEAEANLFADDDDDNDNKTIGESEVVASEASTEKAVSAEDKSIDDDDDSDDDDGDGERDDNSPRKRWVDSYNPSAGLEKLRVRSPEPNLLDL